MSRAIGRAGKPILGLLQAFTLAVWLEGIVTVKWVYPDCRFPMFGWPRPYRAYSECCSLEWNVDWGNYAFDMSIYLLCAAIVVAILRRAFRDQIWRLNVLFWIMIVTTVAWALFQLPMYDKTDFNSLYPMNQLRRAGIVTWGGQSGSYGNCYG